MAAKIRKGDKVVVLTGRDKGRTGEVIEVHPGGEPRAGARRQHGQAPPEADARSRRAASSPRRRRSTCRTWRCADPKDGKPTRVGFKFVAKAATARRCASPSARELRSMADKEDKADEGQEARQGASEAPKPEKGDKASRRRPEGRQGRQGRGKGEAAEGRRSRRRKRRSERVTPRLKTHFEEVVRKQLTEQFGYKNRDAGAAHRQDRPQHGRRRGRQRPQEGRVGGRRSGADRRPEGGDHQGAQVDRHLQAARGPADRLQGDAAQDAHVRVPRPAGDHRAAARARLPRAQSRRASTAAATTRIGIKEHIIFPEIDYDKANEIWGMDIIVCTTAKTDDEARALLTAFNFPFRQ